MAGVVWATACGDADPDVTGPTPVRNRVPQAVGTIPEQTPSVGETATVDLSSYFSDPDGDALSYTAASSNAGVAGVSVSGSSVVVTTFAKGAATVTVTARDPQGLLAQQRFQVTVPNRAPEAMDAIPARTVFAGRTASVDASLYFRDPDGDPLTYTATSSNPEVATATVAAATITIRAVTSGVATITVSASDPDGGAARQTVQVIVPNREPQAVGTIPEQTLSVGETAMVDVSSYFSDPDGDTLSYTAASSNAGVAGVSVSGSSVVVTAFAKGGVTVTVTARDPQGLVAQQRFQLTVPNQAPEAVDAIPARTVFAGQTASVDASLYFRDPDGDPLTYTAWSSNPEVATTTVAAATITIRAVASGVATITVSASDPDGGAARQTVQVTVPNREPQAVGTIPERTLSVGETATVDISSYFTDPDGDTLSYTAASSNAGVAEASVSGSAVVIAALARGVVTVTVTARDPRGLAAQQRFQVTVPNRAPEAVDAIPARTVFAGQTASVDASIYFRDPDGDPLTYTATSSNPEVATTTVAAATITIRAVAPGVATVTVNASDPAGGAAQQSVQVIVPNREPEAVDAIPARTVSAGERAAVDMSPYFSDPDGDKLSYTAASSNAGVVVAEVSGDSVVVTALARGVAIVTVTARDPRGLAAQQRFQVTVANRAPEAVGEIPAQAVSAGETATVDVSPYLRTGRGRPFLHRVLIERRGCPGLGVGRCGRGRRARGGPGDRHGDGARPAGSGRAAALPGDGAEPGARGGGRDPRAGGPHRRDGDGGPVSVLQRPGWRRTFLRCGFIEHGGRRGLRDRQFRCGRGARARRCDRHGDGTRSGRPERLVLVRRQRLRTGIPDRTRVRDVRDPGPEGGLRPGRGALDDDSGADGTPGLAGQPNPGLR
ncbi:Ig-like domain-containing protein [Candidatus Palauibacter sp.]|uniref:Ig-like domain-containing protein n=1 Tax=Candidatus Palauibacter sp. TaxID=3101350 RepID=UPI003B01D21C